MIPVPDNCLTQLKYNQVESFRSFSNEKKITDYVYLLQKEKALIDNVQDTLQNKVLKLYQKCIAKPVFPCKMWKFPKRWKKNTILIPMHKQKYVTIFIDYSSIE